MRRHLLGESLSVALVLGLAVLAAGCMERNTSRLRPRLVFAQEVRVGVGGYRNVDLLLVVDDSQSMADEQINLAAQIPLLVRDLTTPPDRDGNGAPDWGAADRVRIAVVNTDLGTSGAPPPAGLGSNCAGYGEQGRWQGSAECGATPGLQVFAQGEDAEAYADRIGCLVESLGIRGCGVEAQLEAAARGVEAGAGAGFPAADAILGVLVLSDEEDCSLADPGSFYARFTPRNGNVLCQRVAQGQDATDPAWLSSIDTLLERISAGREPEGFVYAAITGIPLDASGDGAAEILERGEMQYAEQLVDGALAPVPACESENGNAAPARRIVELARRAPGSVLHSICDGDFRPAVQELVARIAERLPGVCLTRAIPRLGDRVECRMEETLPAGARCSEVLARLPHAVRDGREVCLIDQVFPGGPTEGFFYDDSDAVCAQLRFTEAAIPMLGASLEVDCTFAVDGPGSATGPIGP